MKKFAFFISSLTKSAEISLSRNSNNFDFIRLLAASLVLIGHSPIVLNDEPFSRDPFAIVFGHSMASFGVLIFFIISGFLIASSWERSKNVLDFFLARVLRIYPALIIVVLLSVFVLGLILTTHSLSDFLLSDVTHKYLQNTTVFRMYYALPGVFESNIHSNSINASLWTIPYEFACYLLLGILGIVHALKNKIITLILFLGLIALDVFYQPELYGVVIPILGIDFKTWYPLLLYFLSGTVYYQFRGLIKFNAVGALISTAILFACSGTFLLSYASLFLLPYIILTIAFSELIPLKNIGKYGDFSYGLYLYAFPVQQLIVHFLPVEISILLMVVLSFGLTFPLALFSWKVIESPSLGLRRKILRS